MARPSKPFPHQGWFKTNIGGRRTKLCRIEEGVQRARELLRNLESERDRTGDKLPPDLTVAKATALFLREVETDKGPSHATFQGYSRWPPSR